MLLLFKPPGLCSCTTASPIRGARREGGAGRAEPRTTVRRGHPGSEHTRRRARVCERVSVRLGKLLPNTREITKGLGSKARHLGVSPYKRRALCDLVSVLLTNHLTTASCSPVTGLSQQSQSPSPSAHRSLCPFIYDGVDLSPCTQWKDTKES